MMSQNSLLYKNLTALLRTFLLDFFLAGNFLSLPIPSSARKSHPEFFWAGDILL